MQLAVLHIRLGELRWSEYWATRAFYRPGLIAFERVGGEVLPGHYFSPFSRTGALAGFVFAAGIYALPAMPVGMTLALRRR